MFDWNRLFLSAYYYGSLPYRKWAHRRATRDGHAPVMILFYHRVSDTNPNNWTMPVRMFQRQIDWLRERFDFVDLQEAQRRINSGYNDRPSVSITFDDGYAENCLTALPLLVKYQLPCTYFVTLENVQRGNAFPHDLTDGIPLKPNSPDQIVAMANAGIEIGSHTRTHPDLGHVSDTAQLYDEVVGARDELEQLIGKPVRYFAFPFGMHANLNDQVFQIARDAGFAGVCSAYGGYNFVGDDPFHLQRFHADPEMLRFKNWLTVDPRKKRVVRYSYSNDCQSSDQIARADPTEDDLRVTK